MDGQSQQSLDYIKALLEEQKHEIYITHSELKLRLPTYLKSATIQQVREAGGTADPDIILPKGAEDRLRKHVSINEKLNEVSEHFKTQVTEHYNAIKKTLPKNFLNQLIGDLNDDDWALLGVDINKFRATH